MTLYRAHAVAMGRTLVYVRLSAIAMSLNYGCHIGQLQLPCLLNCSCHLSSKFQIAIFWTTTAVAMCGLVYCSCHDFKTLGSCHVALKKWHGKKTCSGKRESCHVLTSTLGQLPFKKKELPSAYVHARAVCHVPCKTYGN